MLKDCCTFYSGLVATGVKEQRMVGWNLFKTEDRILLGSRRTILINLILNTYQNNSFLQDKVYTAKEIDPIYIIKLVRMFF